MLPKTPRLTAEEAERLLLRAGFTLIRTQGSHRLYQKESVRVVVPFHVGRILHPKILKQIAAALQKAHDSEP